MRLPHASRRALAVFCAAFAASSAEARQAAPAAVAIPQADLSLETGDTWVQAGRRMRLYGVQACLRGTSYVNAAGASGDCGEASLAYLAAVIRDLKPSCTPIAQTAAETVVVCSADLAGSTLDLGTILTTQGYAFAAFGPDNRPVYMPYLVAELVAKKARSGLWAARSFSHPNQMLSHVIQR
ncbi:Endonuclease YncB, thermonuclease family [Rhizobiales bacterium GAS188]|nr:Endonuclease YncB, thermonuclease family [Rhizobiales bacterium GAS188]